MVLTIYDNQKKMGEAQGCVRALGLPVMVTLCREEEMEYSTIAVLATSKAAGEAYAKDIGLEDYRVVTSEVQAQGLRVKNIVVTPGYLNRTLQEFWEMFRVFGQLEQDVSRTNKPPLLRG